MYHWASGISLISDIVVAGDRKAILSCSPASVGPAVKSFLSLISLHVKEQRRALFVRLRVQSMSGLLCFPGCCLSLVETAEKRALLRRRRRANLPHSCSRDSSCILLLQITCSFHSCPFLLVVALSKNEFSPLCVDVCLDLRRRPWTELRFCR